MNNMSKFNKRKDSNKSYFSTSKCFKENPKGDLVRQVNKKGKIKK